MYNMLSIYDDTSRFLGTWAAETTGILSLPCSTYLILLGQEPERQGRGRRDALHRRHACGMREGCNVGYEDDTLWKVSGRDQLVPGPARMCLFTLCRPKKAGELHLDH